MKRKKRLMTQKTNYQIKKKNYNVLRKGNLHILRKIGSCYYQTNADERKDLKNSMSGETESYLRQNYIEGIISKG